MNVSVIIPARNAEATIGKCVSALRSQSFRGGAAQIIVADDGSTDATALAAREAGAEVLVLPPGGPAAARNRGVALALHPIILFTDADCIPGPDWIERMAAPFEDAGIIATKGAYRTEQRSLTARFVQEEYGSRYRRMRRFDSIDFVDTYAAGFRRELFFRAGCYDEGFPTACVEDQEFSYRYSRLPGKMVFVPEAVVTHLHAGSPWRYFRKKFKIGFWKARVSLRHPGKAIADSHTPQNIKIEMAAVLAILALAPFLAAPVCRWLILGAGAALALSGLPLAAGIAARDWKVGLAAPFLIFLRALGLGLGTVAGGLALLSKPQRAGPAAENAARAAPRAADRQTPPPRPDPLPEHAEEVHESA